MPAVPVRSDEVWTGRTANPRYAIKPPGNPPDYVDEQERYAPRQSDVDIAAQRAHIHAQYERWPKDPAEHDAYLEVPERYSVERSHPRPQDYPVSGVDNHTPGPDPRWDPRPPQRQPQHAPSAYRFFRPFSQDVAWRFSGDHMSMASWSRQYPIFGMAPIPDARNTYRLDPPQRDLTIRDVAPDIEPDTPVAIHETPVAAFGSRSYRLGG